MKGMRVFLLLIYLGAFLVAPIIVLFITALVQHSRSNPGTLSDMYRIAVFFFAIVTIATHYLAEKKTYKRILEKPLKMGLSPQDTLFVVGLVYALSPISYGFILSMIGVGVPPNDMFILAGITYVAEIIWIVRWILKYAKDTA